MGEVRKILVVDDNVDAADLTAEILRMHGLKVDVAYGGIEGIAVAREVMPNVIFLDLGMPGLDGYQVAKELRSDRSFQGVKIIALTAWGDMGVRQKTQDAGFDLHMTKPARLFELVAACE